MLDSESILRTRWPPLGRGHEISMLMEERVMFTQSTRTLVSQCLLGAVLMLHGVIQGCSAVPVNVAAPIPPANVSSQSSLASGRKTYVSLMKCAMCHRPKPVSDYSVKAWTEEILPRMSKKARLSPQEYADVLSYVTATTNQQ